ncbi:BolA family protein [Zoogloea sp.]|uniref:BolA family protein n=1 Tax=Zoogloea sp. TaxID=49181 RepID=UPI002611F1FE|nr:BolA family protein [Zoogloea sp.]MDD3354884.1 BolA family transcriptional regulator [Zoogloea sp.]
MSTAELIRLRLASLAPARLELVDESHLHAGHAGARSGGGHFRLLIVSDAFSGKKTLARQRLVFDALGELMRKEIHALSIQARTPDEV